MQLLKYYKTFSMHKNSCRRFPSKSIPVCDSGLIRDWAFIGSCYSTKETQLCVFGECWYRTEVLPCVDQNHEGSEVKVFSFIKTVRVKTQR